MYYQEQEARLLIIKAGLELIKNKLIARTWGNISARISKDEFIITPSGRSYESLSPEDLVVIKVADASYQGNVKPSSEKVLHAKAYQLRDDCNFIIHTHQPYATAISVDGNNFSFAPCAKYALSGTKALAKSVANSIKENDSSKAFLMRRHGVICLGETYEEAFNVAFNLEKLAKEEYDNNHIEKGIEDNMKPYLDDFAQAFGNSGISIEKDKEVNDLLKEKNALASNYSKTGKKLNVFDVMLQNFVYKKKYSKLKDKRK